VAYYPALNEMLTAATGLGCWWNGRRAHVSESASLDRAFMASCDVGNFGQFGRADEWERLKKSTYARVGCGDAYGYLLVATGRADMMLDPIMNAWDCGPFPPILQEAGGYFGDWQGNVTIYGNEALATNQNLLPDVLRVIRGEHYAR
jgi:myo-inositol-1(or 4)-monophosphatase